MDPSRNAALDRVQSFARLLCAEPLERRWLLSGAGVVPPAAAAPTLSVEVVEDAPAEEEGDGDIEISASQLPPAVLGAFNEAFPGATIAAAEVETEDGQTEYGVSARHEGKDVDVTLSPDGQVLEIESFIPPDELPAEVRNRLNELAPGAQIEEAALVTQDGVESYEVSYSVAGGDREAVFRVSDAAVQPDGDDGAGGTVEPAVSELDQPLTVFAGATLDQAAAVIDEAIGAEGAAGDEDGAADAASPSAPAQADPAGRQPRDASPAVSAPTTRFVLSGRITDALAALAAGSGAAVWVPQLAGTAGDAFPIDFAAVEENLSKLLREVDVAAGRLLGDSTAGSAALRLAVVGAFVGGIQLALLRWRVSKGGPVLVFNARSASSWGWLMGSATND